MNLVLDFGNTRGKMGLFEGGKLVRAAFHEKISAELVKNFIGHARPEAAILSTVVAPDVVLEGFLRSVSFYLRLGATTRIPLVNDYRSRETLGNDRLACAVAAAARFPGQNVLSIDAGTCIKYDVVTAGGHYLGGAISPGLEMRLKALHTFTARLPLVELSKPAKLVGDNTRNSLLSGTVNGAIAEVKETIVRYNLEFNDLKVILTGGDMAYFEESLKNRIFALPDLLLQGLNLILDYNAEAV